MNTTKILNLIDEIDAPWTLYFNRDGTEDIAIILDSDGEELVTSRHFWLPEGDDRIPATLEAVRLMVAAPKFRVGETNSYAVASEIERTLSEALGDAADTSGEEG